MGIAAKMIAVVSLIIIGSITSVLYIATDLFRDESITRAQESNKGLADNLSDRVYTSLQSASRQMKLMAQFASESSSIDEAKRAIENAVAGSEDLVSFNAYYIDAKGQPKIYINQFAETASSEFEIDLQAFRKQVEAVVFYHQYQKSGEFLVLNTAPYTKKSFYTLSFMSSTKASSEQKRKHLYEGRWIFTAEMRHSAILRLFPKNDFSTSYLVSSDASLLAQSGERGPELILSNNSLVESEIVQKMLSSSVNNHQMNYLGDDGYEYLGAFKKIGIAGLGLVTEISKDKATATIRRVQYRSLWVMVLVVCLAFFINYAFSSSITKPITNLFYATEQIVDGNFDVKFKASSTDEIGALSLAFRDMASGLKERDKIKTAFGKFHSKEVAKKLLSGEITLGGERKQTTVFFSDIRGFTAMSEKMSPDQVVALLNEYMTEMVRIIYAWNGVVDKYIGDAIMAVWGVPELNADDAYNAVRASLEMRKFMIDFNRSKRGQSKPEIKIGIGLHSGEVLAGNIGSEERLEYTIIGDTVNAASRIEEANKSLSSDLLISAETYALVKDRGIVAGPPIAITAKGKSAPLYVCQVIGFMNEKSILETELSEEKIKEIHQAIIVSEVKEEKVQLFGKQVNEENPVSSSFGVPDASPVEAQEQGAYPEIQVPLARKPQIQSETPDWYVDIHGQGKASGPFTASEIALKVAQSQIHPEKSFAFREGDSHSIKVSEISGINRREELPAIDLAVPPPLQSEVLKPEDWFVYGPAGENLGPYSKDQIIAMLQGGSISRTNYVWATGLENWIYAYQIPGFDRRLA